jgi:hypothetical protein
MRQFVEASLPNMGGGTVVSNTVTTYCIRVTLSTMVVMALGLALPINTCSFGPS